MPYVHCLDLRDEKRFEARLRRDPELLLAGGLEAVEKVGLRIERVVQAFKFNS